MSKVYVADVGTAIEIDVGENISTATNLKFNVKKGDGTTVSWTPTLLPDSQTLRYITQTGDISCQGDYYVQVSLTIGSWSGKCDTVSFRVYSPYE